MPVRDRLHPLLRDPGDYCPLRGSPQVRHDALFPSAAMGVYEGWFVVAGRGETMPAANHADASGRQLNRRVEVTLVGQQARIFSE